MLNQWLFNLARSRFAVAFMGYAFEYATSLMPVRRLAENRAVLVFRHPVPAWETHWLGVPKRAIRSLTAMQDGDDFTFVEASVDGLIRTAHGRGVRPFTIMVNGGAFQDVPQIHFHLVADWREERPSEPILLDQPYSVAAVIKQTQKMAAGKSAFCLHTHSDNLEQWQLVTVA